MQNNSNNFEQYVKQEQEKDKSVRIIRKEDMQVVNDTKCEHKSLHLDTSDDLFDFMVCNNPNCGKSWAAPKGGWNNKIIKGEKYGR